jgi:formate hydrogenlyase subunit 3/multisubunit Na+/H+ antiporter MnhD subunit
MNAPVLYIVLPAVLGVILAIFNQNVRRNRVISILAVILLALLGLTLPAGTAVNFGSVTLKVSSSLSVLGRQFTITDTDAPFIALMYALVGLWFLGSLVTEVSRWFFPISLVFTSLLVAALSSEVFLFAAPLILAAVILSIPLLSPPETIPGRGVIRYLVFQTLALPCILLAGYILTGFETGPSDSSQALLSAVLLGAGFAFLLGIFPFNTWLPQLMEEAPVYVTGFIMVVLPMSVFWLMIHFIDTYVWIRTNSNIYMVLRVAGILMVMVGSVWACFQSNLRRILAYAIMLDTGYMLLAVGSGTLVGLQVLSANIMTRVINIGLASLSLAFLMKNHPDLEVGKLKGIFIQYPFATSGYLAALLSMAGLPLLANFPLRLVLINELGAGSPLITGLAAAGGIGLVIAFGRILASIYSPVREKKFILNENMLVIILITAAIFFNVLIAFIPGILLTPLGNLLNAFTHLPR